MTTDRGPARLQPRPRPWTATFGFVLLMAFIGCLVYWSAPGLRQGFVLAQALSGGQPLEPLGVMFWALSFAISLLTTLSALGLTWPAVSAFRGSIRSRFLVTMLTLVLVGAMLPWLGYWDDWPLLVTSGVGLTLSWLPPTSQWLSEVGTTNAHEVQRGRRRPYA